MASRYNMSMRDNVLHKLCESGRIKREVDCSRMEEFEDMN